jgi:rhodanese-related sulfurtransferase
MQEIIRFIMAHGLLFLILLVVLGAIIKLEWEESHKNGGGRQAVSPEQAVTLINHEQAVVVDMRSLEEYDQAHISAALSLPLDTLDSQLGSLKKYLNKPLIIYGISSKSFEEVTAKLKEKGAHNSFNLLGGLNAWKAAGMPISKKEIKGLSNG